MIVWFWLGMNRETLVERYRTSRYSEPWFGVPVSAQTWTDQYEPSGFSNNSLTWCIMKCFLCDIGMKLNLSYLGLCWKVFSPFKWLLLFSVLEHYNTAPVRSDSSGLLLKGPELFLPGSRMVKKENPKYDLKLDRLLESEKSKYCSDHVHIIYICWWRNTCSSLVQLH